MNLKLTGVWGEIFFFLHPFLGFDLKKKKVNKHKPFGITPGSINVANVKLAITKKVITPCKAGIHGIR